MQHFDLNRLLDSRPGEIHHASFSGAAKALKLLWFSSGSHQLGRRVKKRPKTALGSIRAQARGGALASKGKLTQIALAAIHLLAVAITTFELPQQSARDRFVTVISHLIGWVQNQNDSIFNAAPLRPLSRAVSWLAEPKEGCPFLAALSEKQL